MIPVNRITRWPFPGHSPLNSLGDGEQLRVEGEEMLSVFGALTLAIGRRDAKKLFEFLKRLAGESAARSGGGVPGILFADAMGEFVGIELDAPEDESEEEDGPGGRESDAGPDDMRE